MGREAQALVIAAGTSLPQNTVRSSLGECSDLQATLLFIEHIAARNARTAREYEREIARLLTWLVARGQSIQDLSYVELSEYLTTLDDQLALLAIAARLPTQQQLDQFERMFAIGSHRPRNGAVPRSGNRARNARPVLVSYLRWLAEAGHRAPIAVPRVREADDEDGERTQPGDTISARKLPQTLWQLVDEEIASMDWTDPSQCVDRAMLVWLRWTGVRRAAFTGALRRDVTDLITRGPGGDGFRFWRVRGKGGKVRRVPLNDAMLLAYRQYNNTMGGFLASKGVDQRVADALFVLPVGASKNLRPANGRDVYVAVAALAQRAAERATTMEEEKQLAKLRPHWFRHRRAFELEQSVSLTAAAAFLGHANVTTTQIYSTAEEIDLAELVYGSAKS